MNKFKMNQKTIFTLLAVFVLAVDSMNAQNGVTGITAGVTILKTYITPITNLTMAIGGIVGIVGGIRVYSKWNSGDNDINKELMGWGGSCVFLIIAPLIVKGFFGV